MTTHTEQRTVLVPEGLSGERVDAAIARMFGLSRTKAAELVAAGEVTLDGIASGESDRVDGGGLSRGGHPRAEAARSSCARRSWRGFASCTTTTHSS